MMLLSSLAPNSQWTEDSPQNNRPSRCDVRFAGFEERGTYIGSRKTKKLYPQPLPIERFTDYSICVLRTVFSMSSLSSVF